MADSVTTTRILEITALVEAEGRKFLLSFDEGSLVVTYPDLDEIPVPGLEGLAWYWSGASAPEISIEAIKNAMVLPAEPFLRRWHRPVEDMPDRYHTYCPKHPEWGVCEKLPDAYRAIADHLEKEHG